MIKLITNLVLFIIIMSQEFSVSERHPTFLLTLKVFGLCPESSREPLEASAGLCSDSPCFYIFIMESFKSIKLERMVQMNPQILVTLAQQLPTQSYFSSPNI